MQIKKIINILTPNTIIKHIYQFQNDFKHYSWKHVRKFIFSVCFLQCCAALCLEIIIQLFLLAEARIWITVPEKRQVLNSTFLLASVFRIKIRPYYLGLRIWIRITANCKDTVQKIRNKWNCNCCNCAAAQFPFWEYINRILFTVQAKIAPNKMEKFHVL